MAATALPAGYSIWSVRLNGAASRRPLYVLSRDGRAIAEARSRATLVRKALAA